MEDIQRSSHHGKLESLYHQIGYVILPKDIGTV